MRNVMVRYRVHQDRIAENEALVAAVYEELRSQQPAGLRYATFALDDGATFVHVASVADGSAGNPLDRLPAFARFQEGIRERCEEPPVVTPLRAIGSYRMLGES